MILIFRSSDFASVFTKNTSSKFKVKLLHPAVFNTGASISLLHLRIPPTKVDTLLYVYCSCANTIQVGGAAERLLQIVPVEKSESQRSYVFDSPLVCDLDCLTVDELKFSIKTSDGVEAAFADEKTVSTLVISIDNGQSV
jgi:hypothetical protein